jgi:phosphatidylglycerol:prolipoprotein diacylglycerol transferase
METIAMLVVCWVLYRMAKKPQPGWYVWGWFMVLAGVERFLIEFIRRNPVVLLGLRTTQWESIASVVIGAAIILLTRNAETVEASLEAVGSASRGARA